MADYVVYCPIGGGIFVVVGHSKQTIDYLNITQDNTNIPIIWWSRDAVNWNVATDGTATPLGVSFSAAISNFNWTSSMIGVVVSGNAADQIFPTTPVK